MPQIIPAILTDKLDLFQIQIKQMEGITDLVQIDVADGIFVPQKTLDAAEIQTVKTLLKYELHLMTTDPGRELRKWSALSNVKRIIFHLEAAKDPTALIQIIKQGGWEAGVALNPETGLEALAGLAYQADLILFMTVTPGKQGQAFRPEVLEKIKMFKEKHPQTAVEVDGGIHQTELPKLLALGVDYIVMGSEIFNHPDPAIRLRELQNQLLISKKD